MGTASLTILIWILGAVVTWRVLRVVLAPLARIWRERPVVMYDEREQRWRAAERL